MVRKALRIDQQVTDGLDLLFAPPKKEYKQELRDIMNENPRLMKMFDKKDDEDVQTRLDDLFW